MPGWTILWIVLYIVCIGCSFFAIGKTNAYDSGAVNLLYVNIALIWLSTGSTAIFAAVYQLLTKGRLIVSNSMLDVRFPAMSHGHQPLIQYIQRRLSATSEMGRREVSNATTAPLDTVLLEGYRAEDPRSGTPPFSQLSDNDRQWNMLRYHQDSPTLKRWFSSVNTAANNMDYPNIAAFYPCIIPTADRNTDYQFMHGGSDDFSKNTTSEYPCIVAETFDDAGSVVRSQDGEFATIAAESPHLEPNDFRHNSSLVTTDSIGRPTTAYLTLSHVLRLIVMYGMPVAGGAFLGFGQWALKMAFKGNISTWPIFTACLSFEVLILPCFIVLIRKFIPSLSSSPRGFNVNEFINRIISRILFSFDIEAAVFLMILVINSVIGCWAWYADYHTFGHLNILSFFFALLAAFCFALSSSTVLASAWMGFSSISIFLLRATALGFMGVACIAIIAVSELSSIMKAHYEEASFAYTLAAGLFQGLSVFAAVKTKDSLWTGQRSPNATTFKVIPFTRIAFSLSSFVVFALVWCVCCYPGKVCYSPYVRLLQPFVFLGLASAVGLALFHRQ